MKIASEGNGAFSINGAIYGRGTLVFTPNEDKTAITVSSLIQSTKTASPQIIFIDVSIQDKTILNSDDVAFTTWDDPDQDDSGAGTLKDYIALTCYQYTIKNKISYITGDSVTKTQTIGVPNGSVLLAIWAQKISSDLLIGGYAVFIDSAAIVDGVLSFDAWLIGNNAGDAVPDGVNYAVSYTMLTAPE